MNSYSGKWLNNAYMDVGSRATQEQLPKNPSVPFNFYSDPKYIKITKTIAGVLKKIDSLGPDLNDSEISKSKDFVTQCLNLYSKNTV